jgi:hypothetical protein
MKITPSRTGATRQPTGDGAERQGRGLPPGLFSGKINTIKPYSPMYLPVPFDRFPGIFPIERSEQATRSREQKIIH